MTLTIKVKYKFTIAFLVELTPRTTLTFSKNILRGRLFTRIEPVLETPYSWYAPIDWLLSGQVVNIPDSRAESPGLDYWPYHFLSNKMVTLVLLRCYLSWHSAAVDMLTS